MALSDKVASTMLPTRDASRAQEFYEKRLRLLPDSTPSPNTAMSFEVSDITAEIEDLAEHGVAFEDYDQPGFTTVDHVFDDGSMKAAWFLDPDGNILCLDQFA